MIPTESSRVLSHEPTEMGNENLSAVAPYTRIAELKIANYFDLVLIRFPGSGADGRRIVKCIREKRKMQTFSINYFLPRLGPSTSIGFRTSFQWNRFPKLIYSAIEVTIDSLDFLHST